MVFEPNAARAEQLAADFEIQLAESNEELLTHCNVVMIAVKPQVLRSVLLPLKEFFLAAQPLLISIAAGVRSSSIEQWLGDDIAIVRVMPNTPALVGAGASGLYANKHVSDQQKIVTAELLNAVGISVWVNNEADLDTVTALSGSGPAYFILFIKSLVEAAEAAGLDSKIAKELAVATATGSAQLIANNSDSLQTLIDNVTSPNGTTEQALKSFGSDNLAEELADELGNEI